MILAAAAAAAAVVVVVVVAPVVFPALRRVMKALQLNEK
jgi:hypothetical protein